MLDENAVSAQSKHCTAYKSTRKVHTYLNGEVPHTSVGGAVVQIQGSVVVAAQLRAPAVQARRAFVEQHLPWVDSDQRKTKSRVTIDLSSKDGIKFILNNHYVQARHNQQPQ